MTNGIATTIPKSNGDMVISSIQVSYNFFAGYATIAHKQMPAFSVI